MLELLEIFGVSMDRGLCGVYLKNELPHHHEPNVAHQSLVIIFSMFFSALQTQLCQRRSPITARLVRSANTGEIMS